MRLSLFTSLFFVFLSVTFQNVQAFTFEPLPKTPPIPKDNPMSPKKIELGRQLYFDPRISLDGTVSCNSCHNVAGSGDDNRSVSVGVAGKKGGRNAPTVWNSAFMTVMFWDGREASLEGQAKGPMTNPVEMAMANHGLVVERISAIPDYVKQFESVFGKKDSLTIDNVAKAIAAYERTLITPNSPVDRFLRGEKNALSSSAKRGMRLVEDKGCIVCHAGPNFAGTQEMGEGRFLKFPMIPGSEYEKKYNLTADQGRFEVTKDDTDRNVWRVPTWRNVALTAPYFHNGSVATLHEAVRVMVKVQLDKEISDDEVNDIVAFLEGLTGEFPAQKLPRLPQTPTKTLIPVERNTASTPE